MARTIATNTTVDRAELVEFLRPRHRVILLTPRSDGGWQGSPVTAGVDDEGRIVVATYPERAKAANVARHGRAAVLALSDEFDGPWVQVEGPAELLTPARRAGAAGRVLPVHLRRAPGLGRVPGGDDRAGQGADPDHPRALGPDRHRRLPGPARPEA